MRYSQLLDIVGPEPLFETSLLVAGNVSAYQSQRRLTDWSKAGKVMPLRRGLYALPKAVRAVEPHPFVIANRLVAGSYVSLEMALGYYSLIPEHVAVITNVTTGRPSKWKNEFGRFFYRHLHPRYFFGMEYRHISALPSFAYHKQRLPLGIKNQYAYIAYPEKALLDFIYLRPGGDSPDFIESLRLQHLEQLDLDRLQQFATRFNKPKLRRAAAIIRQLAEMEAAEYEIL
ncbi:MAG: type IV toxin-antitoxin system AbiEi family antitoxin domain-containing protein [Ardenticatenaceae bacterium]